MPAEKIRNWAFFFSSTDLCGNFWQT